MARIQSDKDLYISYFSISYLSENDGPGKRLVLFMQGCPLDCAWCHSPHSQPMQSPLLYFEGLCRKCGICTEECPNGVHQFIGDAHVLKREHCDYCGACIDACPQSSSLRHTGALVLPTETKDVESLFEMLRPHLDFVKKEGGITFSGGEPLLQAAALKQLAAKCKKAGYHVALETSGIASAENLRELIDYVDTWLIGLRLMVDNKKGVQQRLEQACRQTLQLLRQESNADLIVRIPVIPGHTTDAAYLEKVLQLKSEFGISNIELLRHNPESSHYYKATDLQPQLEYDRAEADLYFDQMNRFLNN